MTPLVAPPCRQPQRRLLPAASLPRPSAATAVDLAPGGRARLTAEGVLVERPGAPALLLDAGHGLPLRHPTCLAATPTGDLWLGSEHSAARWSHGRFEFYGGRRWLPDDRVEALRALPDGSVQAWTPAGVSQIDFPTLTLDDKAVHYEQLTDARHQRFGYVTGCRLLAPGNLEHTVHHIDDNDGLWTAMYIAAQAFRFAATGAQDARRKARRSLRALLDLERLTPIPGFPARALTHRSEPDFGRPREGEWHPTADGQWEWKGDTSSDELDGHYFAWPIYADLVATPEERAEIAQTVRRVTDHLLEHDLCLVDLDGQPTRWGVWTPRRLNDDPAWRAERGLNSLEILAYLRVAHHLTGEARYEDAARELADAHHYARNTLEQKVMPGDFPGAHVNHSDDELAFLAYYALLRYEPAGPRRDLYLASLERTWQIERPEACPLWNAMYGALSGRPWDGEAALQALADIPLDLVDWRTVNGQRPDLPPNPESDRHGHPQLARPLPWRERPLHKWNGNPYTLDGGTDQTEECGTFWLLPYWLARHHGLV